MNKINIYVLTFFLSLAGVSIYAQNNRSQVVITSGQDNNVFFHTIERGQTVYAIATMYGVTPDDIYRLNPDSKEGIKAGATLKIPQRDIVGGTAKKQDGNYIFHTIQPKETLYSLSIRYTVPATAIVKANPGLSTSTFTIGKTIRIPATQVEDLPTTELKTVNKEIEYTVKEINIPNGYTNHITIDENGNIVVTNTHVSATVYPPDDSSHNNMHTANTGDASNNFIWVLMLVVSVSGMVSILFVKRNRNR